MRKDFEEFEDIGEYMPKNRVGSSKQEVLDEVFKKAEVSKVIKKNSHKQYKNKPFLKSGIILIFVAFICWIIIVNVPWVYVKTDSQYYGQTESFISLRDVDDLVVEEDIKNVFEPNNCSKNSCSFVGLNFDDFNHDSKMITYCLFAFIIIGLIFTLFQLIDKIRTFSIESFMLVHSLFAMFTIIVGIFLLVIFIRYIGLHLMLYHNMSYIAQKLYIDNVTIIFPVILIFVLLICGVVKISFSILKMNFVEFNKKTKAENSVNPFYVHKHGRRGG